MRIQQQIKNEYELEQLIIGSMLGDGYLAKISGSFHESRISIAHKLSHLQYLEFKRDILSKSNLNGKIGLNKIVNNRYKNGFIEECRIKSKIHPFFSKYRKYFYPEGKKLLHKETINRIQPLALAIWFMDDGYRESISYGISTQGFKLEEVQYLSDLLRNQFSIKSNIHKDNNLYIPVESKESFNKIIEPHIIECMRYKVLNKTR